MPDAILSRAEATRAGALRSVAEALMAQAAGLEAAAQAISLLALEPEGAPSGPDEMLTVDEAAAELKRSPAFVRSACRRGSIKALKDGHGYRLRRSALTTYEIRRTA